MTKQDDYRLFDKACTIFCVEKRDLIHPFLEKHAAGLKVATKGRGEHWTDVTLQHKAATLKINCLRDAGAGNEGPAATFNKIVLGTANFFKDVPRKKDVRQRVLDHVYDTFTLLGCVGDPSFNGALGHYELLFGIAGVMRGLIFDGQGMLEPNGRLLFDNRGRSGLQVWSPAR